MRKSNCLFMIVLIITFFTGTMYVSAAMQTTPVVSDSLRAEYSDDYFLASAVNKSNDLAQLSIVASDVAYKDTTTFLKTCGFLDIIDKKIDKNHQTLMLHPIKVTIGHKTISFDKKDYDLYAILVRGTTDAMEWVSNCDLTSLNKESANQFVIPKNEIKLLFDSYKKDYFTPGATVKIWVTGHSRGGAVANLLAHELSDKYSASNVYAYTFASANVVTKKIEDTNIFNYIIQEDIVPKVPPGYVRHGNDIVLNTKGYMYNLYQQMTSKKYEGTVVQAHSLEAYMCAFVNTIAFPEDAVRISMNITSKNLYIGEKVLLEADVSGTSSKVKWTSNNKKVATVGSNGLVVAKKVGTVTITATVNGVTAKCKITVIKKPANNSKVTKAKQEYLSYLMKAKNYNSRFAVVDVDGDKIPELITVNQYGSITIERYDADYKGWDTFVGAHHRRKISSGDNIYINKPKNYVVECIISQNTYQYQISNLKTGNWIRYYWKLDDGSMSRLIYGGTTERIESIKWKKEITNYLKGTICYSVNNTKLYENTALNRKKYLS